MFKLAKALNQPGRGEANIGQVARAISWSFFGVRKGEDLEHDAAKIYHPTAVDRESAIAAQRLSSAGGRHRREGRMRHATAGRLQRLVGQGMSLQG